ncbi:MAG: C69 family dipeptidase [Acidobacteriota bacterium]
MKVKKKLFSFIVIFLTLVLATLYIINFPLSKAVNPENERLECFMIMAGRDTTTDGSVLLAHNNDLTGKEASLIEKFPGLKHEPGEHILFPSGLKIPQVDETLEWMVLRIYKGFAEGDAVAVNEFQVAIAGGLALGDDRNENAVKADPLIKKGLTGGVRYIALQRSRTARECVELIGSLYTKHGVTYPSGVGIADPDEIWYMESGGGRSWAAVRIPDDAVWVQANGYRIGEIDFKDKSNFLTSPKLKEFAVKKGLWNPSGGKFNFARAFGRKKRTPENRFYNSRRIWRGMSLLEPSLDLDPDSEKFPLFIRPEEKINLKKLFSILRDHYNGTRYDIYSEKEDSRRERSIAVPGSVHTNVLQLRGWMPHDIGAVLWAGVGPVPFSIYVPFYFGINTVPEPFGKAGKEYDQGSAFRIFRSLCDLITPRFNKFAGKIIGEWKIFETEELVRQDKIEKKAMLLFRKNKAAGKQYLTEYTGTQAIRSLKKGEIKLKEFQKKVKSG